MTFALSRPWRIEASSGPSPVGPATRADWTWPRPSAWPTPELHPAVAAMPQLPGPQLSRLPRGAVHSSPPRLAFIAASCHPAAPVAVLCRKLAGFVIACCRGDGDHGLIRPSPWTVSAITLGDTGR